MKTTLLLFGLAVLLAASACSKNEAAGASEMPLAASGEDALPNQAATAGMAKTDVARQVHAGTPAAIAPAEAPIRRVIRNGTLTVRVESVEKAEDKVVALVSGVGGYTDSAESTDLASATPQLEMKLRVPSATFERVMEGLETLGVRLAKTVKTEDVTAGIVDMEARMKIMKAQEEVLRRMLAKANGNQEMIDTQSKLMELRGSIESLESQHRTLSKLATLSTIEVTLQQGSEGAVAATADPNWAKEAWGASVSSMGNVARVIGSGLIWLLVFAPIWLPAMLLMRSFWRKSQPGPGPKFDLTA